MANTNMSIENVKSVVNSLECSPSMHDSAGTAIGKPKKMALPARAATVGQQTSEFHGASKGKKK